MENIVVVFISAMKTNEVVCIFEHVQYEELLLIQEFCPMNHIGKEPQTHSQFRSFQCQMRYLGSLGVLPDVQEILTGDNCTHSENVDLQLTDITDRFSASSSRESFTYSYCDTSRLAR